MIKAEMSFHNRVGGVKVFDKMELFSVLFADSFTADVLCLLSATVCTLGSLWDHVNEWRCTLIIVTDSFLV